MSKMNVEFIADENIDETYAKPIRIIHTLIALCTIGQLTLGETMTIPEVESANEPPAVKTLGYEMHEVLGVLLITLIIMRLALAFFPLKGASWAELFPYLSKKGRAEMKSELKTQMPKWKKLKLAHPDEGISLARSIHGFIVISLGIMSVTGIMLFLGWNNAAPQTEFIEMISEIHTTNVGILEALLGVHILAVIIHTLQKHDIMKRIKI